MAASSSTHRRLGDHRTPVTAALAADDDQRHRLAHRVPAGGRVAPGRPSSHRQRSTASSSTPGRRRRLRLDEATRWTEAPASYLLQVSADGRRWTDVSRGHGTGEPAVLSTPHSEIHYMRTDFAAAADVAERVCRRSPRCACFADPSPRSPINGPGSTVSQGHPLPGRHRCSWLAVDHRHPIPETPMPTRTTSTASSPPFGPWCTASARTSTLTRRPATTGRCAHGDAPAGTTEAMRRVGGGRGAGPRRPWGTTARAGQPSGATSSDRLIGLADAWAPDALGGRARRRARETSATWRSWS